MNLDLYSLLAIRTLNDLESSEANLAHMALGITGEAGEVADIIKKHYAYGKPLDTLHLIEEVGDIMFYLNGLLVEVGADWNEVLEVNIKKLEARYPDLKFNADHAINRDVDAECEAMIGAAWVAAEDAAAREFLSGPPDNSKWFTVERK